MKAKDEIEQLLPWYATGKLTDRDKKIVDDYLSENPDVMRQLALIEEESDAAIQANEALGAPSPQILDQLMTQIRARESARPKSILERVLGMLPTLDTPSLQIAGLAAAALIIAQAAIIGILMTSDPDGGKFSTASDGTVSAQQPYLLVAFDDKATAGQISQILEDLDLSIVSGPKGAGLYELTFTQGPPTSEEIAQTLAALKKHRAITQILQAGD